MHWRGVLDWQGSNPIKSTDDALWLVGYWCLTSLNIAEMISDRCPVFVVWW